jgi:hypothetical protein
MHIAIEVTRRLKLDSCVIRGRTCACVCECVFEGGVGLGVEGGGGGVGGDFIQDSGVCFGVNTV